MDEKMLSLTFLFGLVIFAEGNTNRNWKSVPNPFASQQSNRPHGRRRSFIDALPGPPGQSLPGEAVQFTLLHQSCHLKEITQNVTESGCETASIRNGMCYGVCAGIHIPGAPGSKPVNLCHQCQPAGQKGTVTVTLKCAQGKTRTVTVHTVERCACSPCNG